MASLPLVKRGMARQATQGKVSSWVRFGVLSKPARQARLVAPLDRSWQERLGMDGIGEGGRAVRGPAGYATLDCASPGVPRQAMQCWVSHVCATLSPARQARHGPARLGTARRGRRGSSVQCCFRRSYSRQASLGPFRSGKAERDRQGRRGMAGLAMHGGVGRTCPGTVRQERYRQSRIWLGTAEHGRQGEAGLGRSGAVERGRQGGLWRVVAMTGMDMHSAARQARQAGLGEARIGDIRPGSAW